MRKGATASAPRRPARALPSERRDPVPACAVALGRCRIRSEEGRPSRCVVCSARVRRRQAPKLPCPPAVCRSRGERRAGKEAVARANDARAPLFPPPGAASGKAAPPYVLRHWRFVDTSAISGTSRGRPHHGDPPGRPRRCRRRGGTPFPPVPLPSGDRQRRQAGKPAPRTARMTRGRYAERRDRVRTTGVPPVRRSPPGIASGRGKEVPRARRTTLRRRISPAQHGTYAKPQKSWEATDEARWYC